MIGHYCYVTASWFFYDVFYWTIESTATAAYILPYWFGSNLSCWITGYSIWVTPENIPTEITYRVSEPPYGQYAPVAAYLWYINYPYSYAYFGSYLPDLIQFANISWYLHHANYFWWISYLAWESFSCHMWQNIHSYPWWFLIIWDF